MKEIFRMNPAWVIGLAFLSLIGFAGNSIAGEYVRDESGLTEEMRRSSVINDHCEMWGMPVAEKIDSVGLTADGRFVNIRADIELIPNGNWFMGENAHLVREYVKIWIDWDRDGQFGRGNGEDDGEEAGEYVTELSGAVSEYYQREDGKFIISFEYTSDIPGWYDGGDTWARVALKFNSSIGNSCGSLRFGDVLDVPLEIPDSGSPVPEGMYIDDPDNQGSAVSKKPGDRVTVANLLSYDGHAPVNVTLVIEVPDNWECGCWKKYDDSGKRDSVGGALICGGQEIRIENIVLRGPARVELYMRIPENAAQEEVCVSSRLLSEDGEQLGEMMTADLLIGDGESNVVLADVYADDASGGRITVNKAAGDLIEIVHVLSNDGRDAGVTLTAEVPDNWIFKKWYKRDDSAGTGSEDHTESNPGFRDTPFSTTKKYAVSTDIPALGSGGTVQVGMRFQIPENASPESVSISSGISSEPGKVLSANSVLIMKKPKAVIVTNRDNLYEIYKDKDGKTTDLLRTLFSIADGKDDGELQSLIYYADWYDDEIRDWDNQDCRSLYCSEVKCRRLRALGISERDYSLDCDIQESHPWIPARGIRWYENWEENETDPLNSLKISLRGLYDDPSPSECSTEIPDNSVAVALEGKVKEWTGKLNPEYLLIVGGDEILPFHRLPDPDNLWPNNWTPAVLYMGYYFSDVFHYTDYNELTGSKVPRGDESEPEEFSYYAITDDSKVNISCGRIVGASADDMLSLIRKGLRGPQGENNIVLASTWDGVVKHMDELLLPLFGTFGSGIRINGLGYDHCLLRNYISTCLEESSSYTQPCSWNSDSGGAACPNDRNTGWLIESGTWGCSDFVNAVNSRNPKYVLEASHSYPLYFSVPKETEADSLRPCTTVADSMVCANHQTMPCNRMNYKDICPDEGERCVEYSWTRENDSARHACTTHYLDSDLRELSAFVAMMGCVTGGIEERSDSHTSSLAYEFIHKGACGYFASTIFVYSDNSGLSYPVFGARLYNLFVGNLANSDAAVANPDTITVGNAFRKALNEYRGIDEVYWREASETEKRVPNMYKHLRTPTQFQLYGIPWMKTNLPYPPDSSGEKGENMFFKSRKGYTSREDRPKNEDSRVAVRSDMRSGGTFSKTFTFNVSDYNVTQQDAFDLVEIPGAENNVADYLPVLPFLMATLKLPEGASVLSARLTGGTTESLGMLSIPTYLLIPGPDAPPSFTDVMYVTGLYPEPNCSHRVFHGDDYTEVIIYFAPVQHNADTKETTLWTEATVEVQYEVDECIFISALRTDKEDYITTEPVIVTATLQNVGDTDVTGLTATVTVTDIIEQTFGVTQEPVESVPAGGSRDVTVTVDNGLNTDTYDLLLEIRDTDGSVVASLSDWVKVTSGRTEIRLSGESLMPGDQLDLTITYENYHTYQVTADILFELYDEKYRMVMAVPGSPTEIAAGSSESMTWHLYTGNLAPGEYEVVAVAEMESGDCVARSEFVVRDPDDLNCDLAVTLADAFIALRLLVSEDTPPEFCFGDIDGDRKTGLAEVIHILRRVAGQDR